MGSWYAGVMNSGYDCELRHHGITGQKWGVRNGPPYPLENNMTVSDDERHMGIQNLKGAKTANLDQWGKDASHNVLYIIGQSGSGKSTTARALSKPGDTVVHLDLYVEPGLQESDGRNNKFSSYLDKNVPKWREIADSADPNKKASFDHFSKEYWKTVDDFREAIQSYGIREFTKGHRVIVEGVQLADDWWGGGPNYFKGQPLIVVETGMLKSMKRAMDRDGRDKNFIKSFLGYDNPMEVVKWRMSANKRTQSVAKSADAKRHQKYMKEFISRR